MGVEDKTMDNTSQAMQSDYEFDRHARQSDKAYNELLRTEKKLQDAKTKNVCGEADCKYCSGELKEFPDGLHGENDKRRKKPGKPIQWENFDCGRLLAVFFRMVWQHVKLACWLTVGLGLIMLIFSANSKKQQSLGSNPLMWLFQFILGAIGLPLLVLFIFVGWLHDDHRVIFNLGLLVIYLVWLWLNVRFCAVPGEFWVKRGTSVRRRVWMDDVWGPDWENKPQFQEAARPWFNAFRKWLGETFESDESGLSEAKLYTDLMACTDLQRIEFFADQTADLPVGYTDKELGDLTLVAMAPWLLLAALALAAIPWH